MPRLLALVALALVGPAALAAQTDYRNLDDGHPSAIEDAYPVEYKAFELALSYAYERGEGVRLHRTTPELVWGALPGLEVGASLGLAALTAPADRSGLAGARGFLLYNFFNEARHLPAVSLRGDLSLPVGSLGGDGARGQLKLLATRSAGRWRLHGNVAYGFGDPTRPSTADPLPRWSAGAALDRTLFRQSLLLVGDVAASALTRTTPTAVTAGAGLRWQWKPTLVLDAGFRRRLTSEGPDIALTVGLSHAFGFASTPRPHPDRPPASTEREPPALEPRGEQFYYPGSFNWQFLARYPDAARLFNAFDYGHAVLYERLLTEPRMPRATLESREYDYLTTDLLRRPPRYGVAEEAIEPNYARVAWKAKLMFDWAHLLHRQIYDIYADERLDDAERIRMVERVTDYYLSNRRLAFTTAPKTMALMDEQYFSQVFRTRYPKFNGLIWSYHWLQIGLYEPLITGRTTEERRAGVRAALDHFWAMVQQAPSGMPQVMPMTASVSPAFSHRHPRAAVIFDNLHMMHDIISDILASDSIPAPRKRAEIYGALAKFQDPTRDTIPMEHWEMMGEMMGGVELMGGAAPRADVQPR
jgi:hypothetical protein